MLIKPSSASDIFISWVLITLPNPSPDSLL
nr:MAG TPA: hypothetical protein [Caudoviricetes sp.]